MDDNNSEVEEETDMDWNIRKRRVIQSLSNWVLSNLMVQQVCPSSRENLAHLSED